jgi:hypothetical protein
MPTRYGWFPCYFGGCWRAGLLLCHPRKLCRGFNHPRRCYCVLLYYVWDWSDSGVDLLGLCHQRLCVMVLGDDVVMQM